MTPTVAMPAVFIGHGTPMNALDHNRYTEAWSSFAASIPRPRAILAVSAHWYINATAVTAMAAPKTIHDFFGFPDELFAMRYPAPGSPEIADEISEVVKPTWVGLDHDSWGLDHGTWSVLVHMFPAADIPVLQLSIDASKPLEYHVALGAQLSELRARGVLIVASGNVVHNLGILEWNQPEAGFDWAHDFNETARGLMTEHPGEITRLRDHHAYRLAVPTADHFLPLLYIAGLAGAADTGAEVLIDGYAYGSLSMTSYALAAAS
ncbi:MAG: dioxygenase extradiol [Ilumatobacteraceae bacterium]